MDRSLRLFGLNVAPWMLTLGLLLLSACLSVEQVEPDAGMASEQGRDPDAKGKDGPAMEDPDGDGAPGDDEPADDGDGDDGDGDDGEQPDPRSDDEPAARTKSVEKVDLLFVIDDSRAYPPTRIVEVAKGFGENGLVQSICQDDLGPAVDAIADLITRRLGVAK